MSLEKVNELRNKRATLITEARAMLDAAESEKRELSGEEKQKWETIHDDARKLKEQAEREERQILLDSEMREFSGKPGADNPAETPEERTRKAFRSYLVSGIDGEYRDLVNDTGDKGGFLHAPEQYVAELLKGLDDQVFIRQYATTHRLVQNDTLGVPILTDDPSDPEWTAEVAPIGKDTQMGVGKREMKPQQLSKRILVSKKLLRTSAIPVENLVRDRLSYRFAVTLENNFLNGSGVDQPLGVFKASTNGIPTSRDISKGNTATAVTGDGLIAAKYAVKQQYRNRNSLRWLFHRSVVEEIAKLKDADGQYLWRPSLAANEPDRLLNIPVDESEYAPSTMTAGMYAGILADWSFYWICELMDLEIQRLNELYAETSQVGFIGQGYWDGAPVMPEAFARVTLASA